MLNVLANLRRWPILSVRQHSRSFATLSSLGCSDKRVSTVPTPAQGATVGVTAVLQVFPHVLACFVYEADLTGLRWLTRGFIKESDS